jgi:hypothetical protein
VVVAACVCGISGVAGATTWLLGMGGASTGAAAAGRETAGHATVPERTGHRTSRQRYPAGAQAVNRSARSGTVPCASPVVARVEVHAVTDTCAQSSRARPEALIGTAPVATGWVLVEQPGPWGPKALHGSGLDPTLGRRLASAVADVPVRVQLVRRPSGAWSRPGRRSVVLNHAGRTPWTEVLELSDDALLETLDPTLTLAATPPGIGAPHDGPLLLVCTHGRRDRCCATLGRPVADTLAAMYPHATWEVSHVGGHRFAGNLVVLPEGLVYGGLGVAEAVRVVDLHRVGRVERSLLRGRSALSRPAQTAELAVLDRLDDDHLGAARVEELETGPDGTHRAVVTTAGGVRYHVEVVRQPTGDPFLLSCDATEPEDPGVHRVRTLTPDR